MKTKELIVKLKIEHEDIYRELDAILQSLTKVKVDRNDEHLISSCKKLLSYVKDLLDNHFKEEEDSLFPNYSNEHPGIIERLIADHHEIREKFNPLSEKFETFVNDDNRGAIDYKQSLLFPAYNLIGTINHHAQREDRELFE